MSLDPTTPDASTTGQRRDGTGHQLGWEPGRARLTDAGAAPQTKRPFTARPGVLPELTEADVRPRPLWKHPAFIVSIITTFIALVVGGVLIVLSLTGGGPARVSSLELTVGSGNAHLTWSVPDVPVDLYVVDADGASDLTQLVRGEEAWIPVAADLFDDESCFVVRAADRATDEVSLAADDLDAQGAASACVADVAP